MIVSENEISISWNKADQQIWFQKFQIKSTGFFLRIIQKELRKK